MESSNYMKKLVYTKNRGDSHQEGGTGILLAAFQSLFSSFGINYPIITCFTHKYFLIKYVAISFPVTLEKVLQLCHFWVDAEDPLKCSF